MCISVEHMSGYGQQKVACLSVQPRFNRGKQLVGLGLRSKRRCNKITWAMVKPNHMEARAKPELYHAVKPLL